jgi:hypothetical protein
MGRAELRKVKRKNRLRLFFITGPFEEVNSCWILTSGREIPWKPERVS